MLQVLVLTVGADDVDGLRVRGDLAFPGFGFRGPCSVAQPSWVICQRIVVPSRVATTSAFVTSSRPMPSSAVPASTATQFTGIGPVWQAGPRSADECRSPA